MSSGNSTPLDLVPDPVYQSPVIQMIVNRLMKKGKKTVAYALCYGAMKNIEESTQQDPVQVIEQAIRNVTPNLELKSKRRGGATFQVPVPVSGRRGTALAIRWILTACRKRSGRTMASKLSNEFLDASKNMGAAVRKKEEMAKMAEANRVYSTGRF
jgi:small subunit ribosomal protein S7|uniref:Small ribosomal subunit protein uS7c n=1 Tax=Choricystis parasitica TaxID=41300 RepID=A0A097KNZ1_9CHLO|nr:ribosomal protein S7 [Choricystis parasitica]AIT94885.1 ribosomal protein S7 [Choricystis parasitica]